MRNFLRLLFGLLLVTLVILFCALLFEKFLTEETIEIKVTKIEKVTSEDEELYYLIHTKHEIFENRDYYFHNKSNMIKLNSKLKPKGEYKVKVAGFDFDEKIPLFLEHRNILELVETKSFYRKKPPKQ